MANPCRYCLLLLLTGPCQEPNWDGPAGYRREGQLTHGWQQSLRMRLMGAGLHTCRLVILTGHWHHSMAQLPRARVLLGTALGIMSTAAWLRGQAWMLQCRQRLSSTGCLYRLSGCHLPHPTIR